MNLHYILSRTQVKARPSVLWCYKNELGFSTHRKKVGILLETVASECSWLNLSLVMAWSLLQRMRQIKRQVQRGLHDPDKDDPFDLFISSTNIRWVGR